MRANLASMFYASFGEYLLALRFRTGLSQTQLAVAAGIKRQSLVRWEQGEAFPQSATLQRLIVALTRHRAFTPGYEADEATALWEHANNEGSRRFPIFDEDWFATLLARIPQAATSSPLFDWGGAAVAPLFRGRDADLAQLRHWLMDDGCRVVGIFGAGGVGKSSLAISFAHQVTQYFEVIIFRSLHNAPPLHETLESMLRLFRLPGSRDSHTSSQREALGALLRERRCLIILDNLETIMQAGERLGEYRPGYADYGELIRLIAESTHRSCLLVTSRERPRHFWLLDQQGTAVHSLMLQGLSPRSCQALLAPAGIVGALEDWDSFAQHYSGNPLAMKLVAETIRNRFDRDLAAFLRHSDRILHEMRDVLAAQIERTSDPEYALLLWLAIEREPTSAQQLVLDVAGAISEARVLQALETLLQRTLIERVNQDTFLLQPIVQEFLIEQFVEQVASELQQGQLELICRYALLQGAAKEYVRQSQLRLIVEPCLARLRTQRGSSEAVVSALNSYLNVLRDVPLQQQRYGGSNLAHLLAHERGNLRSADLSGLVFLQPNFAGVAMQQADLRGAYVYHAVFTGQRSTSYNTAVSPDNSVIASGSEDHTVQVWEVATGQRRATHVGWHQSINTLAWHPNGDLASGSSDDTVTIWDSSRGDRIETLPLQTHWSQSLCYSHNGAWLAAGGRDGIIRAWHATRRELLQLRDHSDQVTATTMSPEGQRLASASFDGRVAVWSLQDGTLLGLMGHTNQMILAAAWHPHQDIIASGGMDERITLWDVHRAEPHAILQDHKSFVRAVAWSSDGMLLASADFDGIITVWDWQRQTARVRFAGHTKDVWLVAFHPNQPIVASGSEDGTVRLWDVISGAPLSVLDGGVGAVRSLAWSPEGRWLASGSDAGWIIIWDIETKRELRRFRNERPYENMRIAGIHGITSAQHAILLALGADDTA